MAAIDYDPDYRLFLDHLLRDGSSYALCMPAGDAQPAIRLRFEAPLTGDADFDFECSSGLTQLAPASAEANSVSKPRRGRPRKVRRERDSGVLMEDEDYEMFIQHTRLVDGRMVLEFGGKTIFYESGLAGDGTQVQSDELDEHLCVVVNEAEAVSCGIENRKLEENVGAEGGLRVVNLDYNDLPIEACRAAHIEKNVPSSGDWHWNEVARSPSPSLQGIEGLIWPMEIQNVSPSLFKTRLLQVLQKPFDRNEYEVLLEMAIISQPQRKLKHLRNDSIFYPTNIPGFSYFDHYPDLADQVHGADRYRGLSLLRGFFFWLENVVHEGSFKPWAVPATYREEWYDDCGDVVPQTQ